MTAQSHKAHDPTKNRQAVLRLLRWIGAGNKFLGHGKIVGTHQQFDLTKPADIHRIGAATRRSAENRDLPALEEIPDHPGIKLVSGNEEFDPLVA